MEGGSVNLWIIVHHHRFGTTIGFVESDHEPGEDEVIRALALDFERGREEWIEITVVEQDNIPRLPVTV